METISKERFEALAGYTRRPSPIPILELEWYEVQNERLLGVIILEGEDEEFGGIVLGRDGNGRFRWVMGTAFFEDISKARESLRLELDAQSKEPDRSFEQGDEVKHTTPLLTPIAKPEAMSTTFASLIREERYTPAKGLIEAMSPYFRDLDGNFVEQFQTTAFDARIFELYLFAALHEIGYAFDGTNSAPDYHCIAPWADFNVEAVTVQPTDGTEPPPFPETDEEVLAYNLGYAAIKFGSPLFSKLEKKYWLQEHVAGRPLVFAIQDFHRPMSMMLTRMALPMYLYGWQHDWHHEEDGTLRIQPERITEHRYGDKVIPSGFFSQPGAEHVSAIIQNPHATLSKFTRMGVLAKFGDTKARIVRVGSYQDPDPNASIPIRFAVDVRDPEYSESWVEGMSVFHNPNAINALDARLIPGAAHHYCDADGMMRSDVPDRFPIESMNHVIQLVAGDGTVEPGGDAE